jgi:A/G-specific adenine glycosylase
VQALRENDSLTEEEIKKLWVLESQVEKALKTLLADGLINYQGKNNFRL